MVDITEGSTHYHADYLVPEWANTKTYVTQIDDHIFYRWEK
jgi:spore germination cell wall hydrolase CwlJ-like protein